ncbi:MAG: putative DNA binding domain-containing protein [Bacteroidales bacterium]|nr:putative DNA binding domain-containing protein [Bacteroidales bacterium]
MKAKISSISDQEIKIEFEGGGVFSLPYRIYKKYGFTIGEVIEGEISFDKLRQKEYFEPYHPKYRLGEYYEFDIIELLIEKGRNMIIVEDCFSEKIYVNGFKWQSLPLFTKRKLVCEVVGFRNGHPILRNVDYWHPIYEVGKDYDFEFIGIETTTLRSGDSKLVIKLRGEDGCIHETVPLPSQFGHKFQPKSLKCKVISIGPYLRLEQVDFFDSYFAKIEEIIINDDYVISKYFHELRNDSKPEITELFKQYDSKSSLWAITYCNRILPNKVLDVIDRFDYKEAVIIIDLLLRIENWILNSGLLDSFKKSETRLNIKTKSERLIEKYSHMKESFKMIRDNRFGVEESIKLNNKIPIVAYYLRFNQTELVDFEQLFICLRSIIVESRSGESSSYNLNLLFNAIESQKQNLKHDDVETDFMIGNYKKEVFRGKDELDRFLKLVIYEIFILDVLRETNRRNLFLSEYYKYLSLFYQTDADKKKFLRLSYILNNESNVNISLSDSLLSEIHNLNYFSNILIESFEGIFKKYNIEWQKLHKRKIDNEIIVVKLLRKHRFGFTGEYKQINCILPLSYILSQKLKLCGEMDCDIDLSVRIVESFYNFNIILVRECNPSEENYLLENQITNKTEVGDILKGKIKAINTYGLFITTVAGEGLLHRKNISDYFIIENQLNQLFEIGEEFHVKVLKKGVDNKLELGLKQLKGSPFEYEYNNIEFRIFAPELYQYEKKDSLMLNIDAENKKRHFINGHIFEYFSDLQYDYEGKIKYLKLAKLFYSSIQSSRSYFLNTYINYFDILSDIECAIENNSIDAVNKIIDKANKLHEQLEINTKSIESYPSVFRLVFFLDVLRQFNNTSNDSIESLTSYILSKDKEEFDYQKKIAKFVLSNNLIISEKYDDDFVLKNLRIVYQYLKDGVFDLTDNEQERKQRELKERIAQIRSKIFNEESETVEFKSTLIKPILDPSKQKKLNELQKNQTQKKPNDEIDALVGNNAKKRITHSAMKTLVAFANSKGGTLYIGINDDGEIIGIDHDYSEIGAQSKDEMGKRLDEYITSYIGSSFFGLLKIKFESIEYKDILIIEVDASNEEVFLMKNEAGSKSSDFYIRRHSSSVKLEGKELIEYFKWRFNNSNS